VSQSPRTNPDDGSGQGHGGDDSETSDAGGSVISIDWGSITGVPGPLKEFVEAPVAFIVGTMLSYLLGGIEAIVTEFLEAFGALANAFVYVPRSAASILQRAGGSTGATLLSAISGVLGTFETAAASAGPFAPVLAGVAVAVSIVVTAYAARWLYNRLADAIVPL